MCPTELSIIGKLGNTVHYYIKGKHYSRTYVIPVQPGTGPQKQWWNKFKNGVKAWQALSQAEKDQLDARAKPFRFSGFNLFMREHLS